MAVLRFVRTFYASADGPELVIENQQFKGPIEIICGPFYGRILFKPSVLIQNNVFDFICEEF